MAALIPVYDDGLPLKRRRWRGSLRFTRAHPWSNNRQWRRAYETWVRDTRAAGVVPLDIRQASFEVSSYAYFLVQNAVAKRKGLTLNSTLKQQIQRAVTRQKKVP